MKWILIFTIGLLLNQNLAKACLCKHKPYKRKAKDAVNDSRQIFSAQVFSLDTNINNSMEQLISGCRVNPMSIWRGNIKNGDLLGQIPKEDGTVLTSSCDAQVLSDSYYLFFISGNRLELCDQIIRLDQTEMNTVNNMTLKELKKFLIKKLRNAQKNT